LDELIKLEEKVDALVAIINDLKQKVEDFEAKNSRLITRDKDIKAKIEGLIEKIDSLLF
jgi:FtsZ-binding cell division protein ZapB